MIYRKLSVSLLCVSAILSTASAQTAYLIEGEAFQFKGKWVEEKSSDCLGSAMLRVYQDNNKSPESDAITVVNIQEAGNYNIWIRSQDFANTLRPRTFTLSIDDIPLEAAGNHGFPGFYWQKVGNIDLEKKQTLLRLTDTGNYFGRCDAILMVKDDNINPNNLSNTQIARWRKNPVAMEYETDVLPSLSTPRNITSGYSTVASAANNNIRISFVKLTDGSIVCKTDYFANGSWRRYSGSEEDNRVAIISDKNNLSFNHNNYYPAWDTCKAARRVTIEGKSYSVNIDGDKINPFYAGDLTEARIKSVSKPDSRTIKVIYDCDTPGVLTGYWTVPENGHHINVKFEFKPLDSGTYSIVLHCAKGIRQESVNNVLMPPMFCGKRVPDSTFMLFSSMMTQCISCVEYSSSAGNVSAFICADLDTFSNDWGSYDYSPVGFTLKNSGDEYEPVAFSPIPGMNDSKVTANKIINASFNIGLLPGDWGTALEYVSNNIFNVEDYRNPSGCSLTNTLYNITDLLKDDSFSGWDSTMKGFWDIEVNGEESPTVVQTSPLSILGAAVITNDEDLYINRALPTIEYTLSRNGYRFCKTNSDRFDPLTSQFPTSLYAGLNRLSGNLNPWLESLALPDGEIRSPKGYFCNVLPFRQELAAYEMTGKQTHLDNAVTIADDYVSEILTGNSQIYSQNSFYNSQMSPEWTALLDIYRATGNIHYLEATEVAATHTLAGIKTWPKVLSGTQTIHPENKYDGVTTIWWKGAEQYRLGFPRKEGDAPEHQINAWEVASVGLSIEQPATYFVRTAGKTVRPVYMSNWAPALSELAAYSEKDIYNIYSNNAVMGRAMNYPGYYATGYTDILSSEKFPYVGPDVSSIYFHHIPAYWGMIQDKLIRGITSKGKDLISFPAARQEGFVWFSNNIYGGESGEILDTEVNLWMPKDFIYIDNINVSHIMARGDNKLFVVLSNDSEVDQKTKLMFSDAAQTIISGTHANTYMIDGTSSKVSFNGDSMEIDIPASEMAILEFDAYLENINTLPPLANGMKCIETDTPAGKIYLYRIRSSFGWDSIYGFAECGASQGLSLEIECNDQERNVASFPFEWSFLKFRYEDSISVKIRILQNGTLLKSIEDCFNLSQSSVDTTRDETSIHRSEGIFRADGVKVDRMDLPGLYIVNGRKVLRIGK